MQKLSVFGASLLVAGTCIGAGMLAIPIVTAASGYYLSVALFFAVWSMMTATAYLMLEVSLWFKGEENLISMAEATLGKPGKIIAGVSYVVFLYALMTLYTSGGSEIFYDVLNSFLPGIFSLELAICLYVMIFGSLVYLGTKAVDTFNRVLILGLVLAYSLLVAYVTPNVNIDLIAAGQAKYLFLAVPVLVTSFGFHLLIPSLKYMMGFDLRQLRLAILYGSFIPMLVYLVWEFVVLGTIPMYGDVSMHVIAQSKQPVLQLTNALDNLVKGHGVSFVIRFFTFFAIVSSFIGVSLGLFDFLADGTKMAKQGMSRVSLVMMTFFPATIFSILWPGKFLVILGYAGIFASVLLIIFPSMMVITGRYFSKSSNFSSEYKVSGGVLLPVVTLCFGILVILIEIFKHCGYLPSF